MENDKYSDKKDLVKWTSSLHLAQREGIGRIVQVAMRTDKGPTFPIMKTLGGETVDCQDAAKHATGHFRSIENIKGLGKCCNILIEVWSERFTRKNRVDYFDKVYKKIEKSTEPTVWFFDPNIGIEPEKSAFNDGHVTLHEISVAFNALKLGDYLVCYQDAPRGSKKEVQKNDWRYRARKRLAQKLGKNENEVEVFRSDEVWQAVILAVKKTENQANGRPIPHNS